MFADHTHARTQARALTYTPVSEGRHHESLSTAEELILILEVDVRDGDYRFVRVLVEVEARLLQPLEVARRLHVHPALCESGNACQWKTVSVNCQASTL